jgi:hypothetical protein
MVEGTNTPKRPEGVILRWLEYGTAARTTSIGANRGAIAARNIIVPTITSGVDGVINYLNTDFGTAVESILEKKLKKLNK